MRKTLTATYFLVVIALLLGACAPAEASTTSIDTVGQSPVTSSEPVQPATTTAVQDSSATVELNTSYAGAVSAEVQLLLGTLKLIGSEQTITKEQAAALLPLWTNLQTLSQSMRPGPGAPGQGQSNSTSQTQNTNTETQTQIDELVKQIQAVMTPAQIQAIADMQITQETAMTIMQEIGIGMGGPGQSNGNNSGTSNQPPQGPPPSGGPSDNSGGQPPSGGQQPPTGGQPPSGGQQPPNSGQQPAAGQQPSGGVQNGQNPPAGDMMVPPPLIDSLLQVLEKIQAGENVTAIPTVSANTGGGPGGNPPSGAPSGSGSTNATSGLSTATGAYTLDGSTASQSDQTYTASNQDQSGVYVLNGGKLTLTNITVNTSGNTSSNDSSSFYGLNAGVLAASGSTITMNGGTISTTGSGANGAFATGSGTTVNLTDVTINATGDGGHGVMATQGGSMTLTNVNMTTSGAHSAPIATDRGGGTITSTGGTLNALGQDSPCYYSTGTLNITGSICNATGSEAAVIEGSNTINLTDSTVKSSVSGKWGVMIYQSFSGDAQGSNGVFTMTGGSLSYTDANAPLFYVTNTTGNITLKNVEANAASGILVKAEGNDRWGTSGSNGGTVVFTADGQTLSGSLVADKISSITAALQNGSTFTGAINTDNTAKEMNLTLDKSSTWTVTADSYLTCLTDPDITNINGNGHTVYYNASACPNLGGQAYTLTGGGTLTPAK